MLRPGVCKWQHPNKTTSHAESGRFLRLGTLVTRRLFSYVRHGDVLWVKSLNQKFGFVEVLFKDYPEDESEHETLPGTVLHGLKLIFTQRERANKLALEFNFAETPICEAVSKQMLDDLFLHQVFLVAYGKTRPKAPGALEKVRL